MNSSIVFQYITVLGPVVYFSGNNGLFIDLIMMGERSKEDEIDFEELLEEHLTQYFSEHAHQYIYYRVGEEDSNCQMSIIKGASDGNIAFNYETEFSDFSNNQVVMNGDVTHDSVIIYPNNVDVFYDGTQELKTIKLKISFDALKSKKMKKIDTGKDTPKVVLPKCKN